MELRLPKDTVLLIAEKWVNDNLARPLKVIGLHIDTGCCGTERTLVLELEKGSYEDHASRHDARAE